MKPIKDSWENSWDDMTKYHKSKAPELAVDIWGAWKWWKARKLKAVMDRSRAYWQKKRQRGRVVKMLRLQKRFERAMGEVKKYNITKENSHGMDRNSN